jgi:hypothetical protein
MPRIVTFAEALHETSASKRQLLVGNGFSIALFSESFDYRFLLASADFGNVPQARAAFEALRTTDFEVVIQALRNAVALLAGRRNPATRCMTIWRLPKRTCQNV